MKVNGMDTLQPPIPPSHLGSLFAPPIFKNALSWPHHLDRKLPQIIDWITAPKSTFDDKYVFNPLAPSNDDLASLSLERDKGIVYRYKRQVLHVEFLHLAIGVLNMVGGFVAVFRDKIFPDRSLAIWCRLFH